MTNVMRRTKQRHEQEFAFERLNKRKGTWGSVVHRAKALAKRKGSSIASGDGAWSDDSPSWRPQSALGSYLWLAAKLFQLIDEAADWRLITDHLCAPSPLHPRRTLEQYYYWTAEDTTQRDRQQVIYRATRMRNDTEAIPRVVMVDQLWMWILDESEFVWDGKQQTTEEGRPASNQQQTPFSLRFLGDGAATSPTRLRSTGPSETTWARWTAVKSHRSTTWPSSSLTNAPRSSLIERSQTFDQRWWTCLGLPSPTL